MKTTKQNNTKLALEILDTIIHTGKNTISICECDGDTTAIIKDSDGDLTIIQSSYLGDVSKTRLYDTEIEELKRLICE
jgi:hypothetical protein